MAMEPEVTRLVFKLDSDAFFAVTDLSIGDAVREGGADFFDSKL
jgi:hypothetical protein